MRRILVPIAAALIAAGAIAAGAQGAGGTTVTVRSTKLGRILVTSRGVTLYLFEKDRGGRSACSGACAQGWPPLLTRGRPRAGSGALARKLGTTRRSDGTTQVTYGGHPLYTFVGDGGAPGRTTGEGSKAFGAEWYVVGPNGSKIEARGS